MPSSKTIQPLKIILALLFLTSGLHPSIAQLTSSEIDELATSTLTKFNIAGVAIGIVKDGHIVHAKGYGVKSIQSNEVVDEHTSFAIASNTKAFTSAALAILVEQGKINWRDKVVDHLPEFTMYDPYVTKNFNIQDLLTHRSGLGLGAGDLMFIPPGSNFTMQDVMTSFQYFKPQSEFRSSYDYDNLLYLVAGELISRVSGVTYDEFIEANIFQPLAMDRSFCSLSDGVITSNQAIPHLSIDGKLLEISHFQQMGNDAAGGIRSNVDDLCRWMLLHLNKGRYGEKLEQQLFSEAAQREMWKIHNPFITYPNARYNFHFSGYGLGWELRDIKGNMAAYHGGLLPGMASQTILIPDINLGIIVLINSADKVGFSPTDAIAFTILDSFLGLDDFDWMGKVYPSVQQSDQGADSVVNAVWKKVASNTTKVEMSKYVGTYEDPWFGKVEVSTKGHKLWFQSLRSPLLNGELQPYTQDTFAIRWEYQDLNGDALVFFDVGQEEKGQSITMKGISPNIDFSFDFQDLNLKRIK